jgi:hypothetical protein
MVKTGAPARRSWFGLRIEANKPTPDQLAHVPRPSVDVCVCVCFTPHGTQLREPQGVWWQCTHNFAGNTVQRSHGAESPPLCADGVAACSITTKTKRLSLRSLPLRLAVLEVASQWRSILGASA